MPSMKGVLLRYLVSTHTTCYAKPDKQTYDDILNYKIGDLVMIRIFDKNQIGMQSTYQLSELYNW